MVEPLPHTLLSNFKIEEPVTHGTQTSSDTIGQPNQTDYPMAEPSSTPEEWGDYSPASSYFPAGPYDLLLDEPPPSALPSGASSALPSEVSSPWASGDNLALASEASSLSAAEANSALTSDSDLPPTSFTKATKQTKLHGFFLKVPSEEHHLKWQKRKRDNEDKDREEHTKQKQKDEAHKLQKLSKKRENNSISQRKRRHRLKENKAALCEEDQDSQVSCLFVLCDFSTHS